MTVEKLFLCHDAFCEAAGKIPINVQIEDGVCDMSKGICDNTNCTYHSSKDEKI